MVVQAFKMYSVPFVREIPLHKFILTGKGLTAKIMQHMASISSTLEPVFVGIDSCE